MLRIDTGHGIEERYAGAVLQTWERNGADDSDFCAAVWDETTQRVLEVTWATTRCWTRNNSATVDATPEILAKAEAWLAGVVEELLLDADQREAIDPTVGKVVRVLRGKRAGTVGTIVRREANRFRTYYHNGYMRPEALHNQRVALQVDGQPRWVWTAATNVAVLDPPEPDRAELHQRAVTLAGHRNFMATSWHGPVS